ncbi:hypothetical protein RFI20_001781 [Klebsiella pneumoniae]|uniref:hypothetical protein n=1 Tax=Enterobacterales TaxID=91347 RepID=UPI000DF43810|nr:MULTISPECIES: hypothetical protein [Enterobacterales]HEC2563397.1 hypothetical protein [Raoultella ornithinolytica]ELA2589404.1 hypothetical protein [Klebsiella pneumoniae]ELQ6329425.1 hypothetical protein [Klebsiella pneumoniae]ELT7633289.1 hypothetical protein [Klebsiella pneumoniae]MCW9168211.1 hypothetical protein [Klebsiella pneumoniae]
MAKIPFTNRELVRAWRSSLDVSKSEQRTNPHRLLLFYAIECGLKATYLKQINKTVIDSDIAQQFSHDINKLCEKLSINSSFMLPQSLRMKDCKVDSKDVTRTCSPSEINQIWRYGGTLDGVENDIFLEGKLEKLNEIIEKELTNG